MQKSIWALESRKPSIMMERLFAAHTQDREGVDLGDPARELANDIAGVAGSAFQGCAAGAK
jgi:hypothetical protein